MLMTKEDFKKTINFNTSLYTKMKEKILSGLDEIEKMDNFEGWDFEVDSISEYLNCLFDWDKHSYGKNFWYQVYASFGGK